MAGGVRFSPPPDHAQAPFLRFLMVAEDGGLLGEAVVSGPGADFLHDAPGLDALAAIPIAVETQSTGMGRSIGTARCDRTRGRTRGRFRGGDLGHRPELEAIGIGSLVWS